MKSAFYHDNYQWFKPSGLMGQGLGVVGTVFITFGVAIYIARKRYGFLSRYIRLKYLLEFHIFLCILGPILILFHTTFKFGGIVAIAFWSMVAVVLSGVIGRFIYIQIPRTIEGNELTIKEIQEKRKEFEVVINENELINQDTIDLMLSNDESLKWGFSTRIKNYNKIRKIKNSLKASRLSNKEQTTIIEMAKEEMSLTSKISRLHQMQKLFKYWHVIHMPFAIIMLIIVLIHVGVTITLGYKWIF